MMFEAEYLGNR